MYLLELEPELKEEVVQEELVEYGTELNVVEEGKAIPVLVERGTEVDVREVPAGDASEATPELDEQGTCLWCSIKLVCEIRVRGQS